MAEFLDKYGYLALMMGTFLEGETAILITSSLIRDGVFKMPYTICFGFAGAFISDWLYYTIGRLNGKYFMARRPNLQRRFQTAEKFFIRHKLQLLVSYRFLYGFRIIIPLMIGMSTVKPLQFLGFSIVSGLAWASAVSALGYYIGLLLPLQPNAFEENMLILIPGFACFGLLLGYGIKRLAFKTL